MTNVELHLRPLAMTAALFLIACETTPDPSDDAGCEAYEPLPLSPFTTESTSVPRGCYDLSEAIRIQAEVTLEPGTEVRATDPGAGLRVDSSGTLRAVGDADAPIIFTASTKMPGSWIGLRFESDADNLLRHVLVEYAGNHTNAFHLGSYRTGIRVDSGARLEIDDLTVRRSSTESGWFSAGLFLERDALLAVSGENRFIENDGPGVHVTAPQIHLLASDDDYGAEPLGNGVSGVLVNDDATSAPPTVSDSGTWPALNVPYRLVRAVTIEGEGTVVTIAPGARFEAASDAGIRVRDGAGLRAAGEADDRIVFSGIQAAAGAWPGLHFNTDNSANEIRYAVIEHAGENSLPFNPVGGGGVASAVRLGDRANEGIGAGQPATLSFFDNIVRSSGGSGVRIEHRMTVVMPEAAALPAENAFEDIETTAVEDLRD